MKVTILFANFGPYHLARVNIFRKYCYSLGWEVIGIELARSEAEYPWKTILENINFQVISLISDKQLEEANFFALVSRIIQVLNKIDPDVCVIAGYSRPTMLLTLFWSFYHHKLAILLSESKEDDAVRFWWQEKAKRWIIQLYNSALVGGKQHKRYLRKLRMKSDAIFLGYDVVDNTVFHPTNIRHLPRLIDKPYFLAINRFIPKKNLHFLISSYAKYCEVKGVDSWNLVLCGDGPLRPQIEQQIVQLGLQDFIHLPGFLQQNELLPYFAHAGCFIHASTQEQWGLVVNEAMAAGLPVLVSEKCGCFEDLVVEGVNGFGFDPENIQQLTDLMLKITSKNVDIDKIGDSALKHIQQFSPEYFAKGLVQAIEYSMQ
ncbi:glycosyltransferase [Gloeocapsa sp. BRSZ]